LVFYFHEFAFCLLDSLYPLFCEYLFNDISSRDKKLAPEGFDVVLVKSVYSFIGMAPFPEVVIWLLKRKSFLRLFQGKPLLFSLF